MDLFMTFSLAIVLSFLVAKLITVAMAGDRASELKSTNTSDEAVLEGLHSGDRLCVRSFESQRKVECVEEAVEMIHELVGVSVPSHEVIEVQLERKNEVETSQIPRGLESTGSRDEFDCLELMKKVSETENLDDLKISDSSEVQQVEEINIDDSVIDRNDEKICVKSMNDDATLLITKNENIVQEILVDREEDDDWEGIERSEIENAFLTASKFVGLRDIEDRLANFGREFQMELYGLHKVATEGPCREPQPGPLKVSARAKWNAWQRMGNITPDEAMERYISLLSDTFPGWMDSAGQGIAEPLEAETPSPSAFRTRTLFSQPNNSNESKPTELNIRDERDEDALELEMKNKIKG